MGTEAQQSPSKAEWQLPIIITPIGVILVLMLIFSMLLWFRPQFFDKILGRCQGGDGMAPAHRLRVFKLEELENSTANFTTKIGEGGTATVYKAQLPDGRFVSVKALKVGLWTSEKVFLHEIHLLGRVSHPNLVQLLGFCNEDGRYFLVYEYMPQGALKDHILRVPGSSARFLDWRARVRIAHEIATALEFLHHHLKPPLVHRDIKPENVLLLDDGTAKVSDFGMCYIMSRKESLLRTGVAGTPGFLAPEIARGSMVTEKVDVYSYGIVLLVLITGRWPYKGNFSLIEWIFETVKDERSALEVVDPVLKGDFIPRQLYLMLNIAEQCIQFMPEKRPSMKHVRHALDKIQRRAGDSGPLSRTTSERWR
uniref:non-specific serine/threonine protein kinase n=1 Tax=Nitella axillaris TaxID=3151 RepID=A7VM72_9VIRI|nr:receptor-like kinase [Nitella axillaris]